MALTKAEFRNQYSRMFPTSTKLSDAWRQYQLSGTLPGATAVTTTLATTTPAPTTTPFSGLSANMEQAIKEFYAKTPEEQHQLYVEQGLTPEQIAQQEKYVSAITPIVQTVTPTPVFGEGVGAAIPTPEVTSLPEVSPVPTFEPVEVTPAPAYEISPEQKELQEMLSTTITDWVQAKGYGLPPEMQAQMIQQQTDFLKAREQESIRVMKNNMEKRGITNSGYVQANVNMITSNTSIAIAGAISDVQIKSALMKMASFEKAMGSAAQFLGYLSEQSQLAYKPEFATWGAEQQAAFAAWQANTGGTLEQWRMKESNKFAKWGAEQLTKMQVWQGELDVYKMAINNAYQTGNIELQAQLTSELAEQQHGYDLELANLEIEFQQEAAAAEGAGQLIGSASGLVGTLIAGS